MGVSKNRGTPKSSLFNRIFHYFHHPFWGIPIFGNTHMENIPFLYRVSYVTAGAGFLPSTVAMEYPHFLIGNTSSLMEFPGSLNRWDRYHIISQLARTISGI